MISPDLIEKFVAHAESLHWVERGCYLHERGWFVENSIWKSPHDGSTHEDSVLPMAIEMALEADGTPTKLVR